MKTLRKMDLDEMTRTMNVIPEAELNSIVGAYDPNDCVWHALAYAASCGTNYDDQAAYQMAQQYDGVNKISFDQNNYGFDGSRAQLQNFASQYITSGCTTQILLFDPNQTSGWSGTTGVDHAVVICGTGTSGYCYFDPQSNSYGTMSYQDANNAGKYFIQTQ